MAALNYKQVLLTEVSTGALINLSSGDIVNVQGSGATDSSVTYDDGSGILKTKIFDETQAAIVTAATNLINVTIGGVLTSINVYNVKSVVASGGSDSKISYLSNRAVPDPFIATGITPAAFLTAVNAL